MTSAALLPFALSAPREGIVFGAHSEISDIKHHPEKDNGRHRRNAKEGNTLYHSLKELQNIPSFFSNL